MIVACLYCRELHGIADDDEHTGCAEGFPWILNLDDRPTAEWLRSHGWALENGKLVPAWPEPLGSLSPGEIIE